MSEFGQQIIFTQLLDRHGCVQVPMIQRDYAQGRESEVDVLNTFLDALQEALYRQPDDPTLPLNLDFVYGSVEGQEITRFQPLDGQQRLTTLFLLHWYLAWRDDCTKEFLDILVSNGESRFSYAVRQSATEFYDKLVRFQPQGNPESYRFVSTLITDQPWYYSYWRLDPTIQSCLRVIDAIHKRFNSSSGLYARLTDTENPAISFQLLDLENFGLSDDLYIKINARGKPLTHFETFKARYEQVLSEQFDGETTSLDGQSITVADFFSRRIDTTWADFFWRYRNTETNLFDQAVINFFRLVILLSRETESEKYLDDIRMLRDKWEKSSFSLFQRSGWLDRNFYNLLVLLLETWSEGGSDFGTQLPDKRYFDEISLFSKAIEGPTRLQSTEIVQFVGYVIFLQEHSSSLNQSAFQEWMRIVFNLSNNTVYDRPEEMKRSMAALVKMGPHSDNVIEFFANTERPTEGFYQQQVGEEKLKAELIIADPNWRNLIERAEGHGYFNGQIEFLLDFCGALTKSQELNCGKWDRDAHNQLQGKFKNYLVKVEKMFAPDGLVDLKDFRWERALLCIGDYLLPSRNNLSFLSNSSTEPASWKRLLRGPGTRSTNPRYSEARDLLKQLFDRLNISDSLSGQLDNIIGSVTDIPEWRQAFIDTPEAIKYCWKREIRYESEIRPLYLLRKTQMNGAHAELFTYCLYLNELLPIHNNSGLSPLELEEYYSASSIGVEPGIRLFWQNDDETVYFDIEWNGNNFLTHVAIKELSEFPELHTAMKSIGFSEKDGYNRLERASEPTEVLDVVFDVRRIISEVSG